MLVDFDDFEDSSHRLDLLQKLKLINPEFRCTVFAIPNRCSPELLARTPSWIEIAVHGWDHPTPTEAQEWTRQETLDVMHSIDLSRFTAGFKAPGWQVSDGTYEALSDLGWWIADQPYNDHRRPTGLLTHRLGDGDHWHGHIQNVCGNGLEETFDMLATKVSEATTFQFVSEAVTPWLSE